MKCDSWPSLLARTFASPCLGRELKVRVTTSYVDNNNDVHPKHWSSHQLQAGEIPFIKSPIMSCILTRIVQLLGRKKLAIPMAHYFQITGLHSPIT